jgi:hypothetical protein
VKVLDKVGARTSALKALKALKKLGALKALGPLEFARGGRNF